MKTDDKGRTYYVNTETRKSQWTVPEELKSNVSGSEVVVGMKMQLIKRVVLRTLSRMCQKWLRIAMIRV